jgi:hypothetical protein
VPQWHGVRVACLPFFRAVVQSGSTSRSGRESRMFKSCLPDFRGVAQPGRARRLGRRCWTFKSSHPDFSWFPFLSADCKLAARYKRGGWREVQFLRGSPGPNACGSTSQICKLSRNFVGPILLPNADGTTLNCKQSGLVDLCRQFPCAPHSPNRKVPSGVSRCGVIGNPCDCGSQAGRSNRPIGTSRMLSGLH